MSTALADRELAHQAAGRLSGVFRAVFGIEGAELRDAEQLLLDYIINLKNLSSNPMFKRRNGEVANIINPLNEEARANLSHNICQE